MLWRAALVALFVSGADTGSAGAAATGTLDVKRSGTTLTVTGTLTGPAQTTGDDYVDLMIEPTGDGEGPEGTLAVRPRSVGVTLTSSDGSCASQLGGSFLCTAASASQKFSVVTVDLRNSTGAVVIGEYSLGRLAPGGTVSVTTGSGDDDINIVDAGTANGGSGDDNLHGDSAAGNLNAPQTLNGGTGDDTLDGGAGDDTLNGGAGDDMFKQGDDAEGNDTIDGGTNTAGGGDTIDFSRRSGPVSVTLPAASVASPTGNNGKPGEHDKLAHIEHVDGTPYADTITGNDAANRLFGDAGADAISGGTGDDLIYARSTHLAPVWARDVLQLDPLDPGLNADTDTALACGEGGNDFIWVDYSDAAPTGCEHTAPGLLVPSIVGEPHVGETLSLSPLQTYGDVDDITITWWDWFTHEEPIGTGPTVVIPGDDEDDYIFAEVTVSKGADSYTVFTLDTDAITGLPSTPVIDPSGGGNPGSSAASPVGAPPESSAVAAQAPAPPTIPFGQRSAALVQSVLGAVGSPVPAPALPPGCTLSAAPGSKTLRLTKAPLKPLAVACDHAVSGSARWRLTLTPKNKRAKKQTITLAAQPLTFSREGALAVTLTLSATQKREVRSAKRVDAAVTLSFPGPRGSARTNRTYRLKP